MLSFADRAPVWLEQVHGDNVLPAEQVTGLPQADGSFTQQAQMVCAVMTADCLPVLFCTLDGQKIAAAHAGWRGLLAGILTETLAAMQTKDVWFGWGQPLGLAVLKSVPKYRRLLCKITPFAAAFSKRDAGHYWADIYQLGRIELAGAGVAGCVWRRLLHGH